MNFFQKLKCMQLPYGLRMTELINTSLTGPPKVSTLKIVDILPFNCLASQKSVRILQQKWTCRETGLQRRGCRATSRFRMEVLRQSYETELSNHIRQQYGSRDKNVK